MITNTGIWGAWVDLYNNSTLPVVNNGAPTDGGAGTGANLCGPGTLLMNSAAGTLYINTNTKASPTWLQIGNVNQLQSTSPTAGIGYATGAGGTVTQTTSKTTGVTLLHVSGQIVTHTSSLNDGTTASFTVTATTAITSTSGVIVNHASGGTLGGYLAWANTIASNSYKISIRNISGTTLSEALTLNVQIIRGVTS